MKFEDIEIIWKRTTTELLGADNDFSKSIASWCRKKLEATENFLKLINQNTIETNIYYNLVSDCITEPIYNLLLKNNGEWFNKDQTIPFEKRQNFLDHYLIKFNQDNFDKQSYISYCQNMKAVGVRTFYEASQKIGSDYHYEKLVFLRIVGSIIALAIFSLEYSRKPEDILKLQNNIDMFKKINNEANFFSPPQQIDFLVQSTLEKDVQLSEEIEKIKIGKNNPKFWQEFNLIFDDVLNGKYKVNNQVFEKKTENFFRKLFLLD